VFALADPNITDLLTSEHPKILAGIWVGCRKQWLSAYKSSNISETRQDKTKVTIEPEDPYALSIGAKINDLG